MLAESLESLTSFRIPHIGIGIYIAVVNFFVPNNEAPSVGRKRDTMDVRGKWINRVHFLLRIHIPECRRLAKMAQKAPPIRGENKLRP